MSETLQIKNPSPLVKAVLALDLHFSELLRLSEKIEESDLKTTFDYEQAQRQMERFAKAGQSVSEEVMLLAQILMETRARAEAAAASVAKRAELLNARRHLVQQKMQDYAHLGEQVRDLNLSLQDLKPAGETMTDGEREQLRRQIAEIDLRIQPLIEKAQSLKKDAQESKIKELEQSADSLSQKLKTVSQKLTSITPLH